MKTVLCTISTQSHLFKSYALFDSVMRYSTTELACLVTDSTELPKKNELLFHSINDLNSEDAQKLKAKYKGDELRWALKTLYVKFLLESGYERVIYVDNDIFFYSSPDALFEKLENADFLLTPHFYKADPTKNQNWLEANFRVGLYNAGFFGANKNAIPILDWWAKCCLYEVRKSYWRGLYDDQKYLDLVPVIFDNVEVLKDRICNFAGWNCDEVTFEQKENKHLINGNLLVFVHFAQLTMERFSDESSPYIILYKEYIEAVQKYQPNFLFKGKKISRLALRNYWYYLRWKIASR